jgi:UDP-glucose 4-epimerase
VPVVEFGLSGVAGLAKSLGARGLSLDQVDLFVHGRVVDTTRLTKEYGWTPRSTPDAFCEFLRVHKLGAVLPRDRIAAAERAILDGIRRVRSTVGGHDGAH